MPDPGAAHLRRRPALALLLALLACATWAAGARAALPGADLLTPLLGVPGNIATPDLNGDGLPDLVVPDFGSDLLSVRINQGHGRFGPVRRYAVGLKPSFIAVGDFNRDGHPDLAVSNAASASVSVLLGNGDGSFQPPRTYSISQPGGGLLGLSIGTFSVEAADVTGDGILDLVTANSITNDVSVLAGNGNGTFKAAKTYPIGSHVGDGLLPFALSVGEFDSDHAPDLVVGGLDSVTIMQNNGSGAFHSTHNYFVGLDIACTKVADLNGDGKPDIVATGTGTLNAQVLLGNGDGSFTRGQSLSSGGIGPQCLSIGRLSAGGPLDLAIVNSSSLIGAGDVALFDGDGHGHFKLAAVRPLGLAPWASSIGDFNGDGRQDIAVANTAFPASVSILYDNGHGTLKPAMTYPM
jgi:hypothetical protein